MEDLFLISEMNDHHDEGNLICEY